jgi:hypothetical protein
MIKTRGRTVRQRVAHRLDKQRVISQELSSISVLPNKGRCTPRQAYKFLAIDPRKTTRKTGELQAAGDSVLPSKCWCTLQQGTVYSPANVGVLSNDFWCIPRQEIVYSPTSLVAYFACKRALYTQ